ncbi:MAG: hypothetical protein HKN12_04510, partial [Gemmatimonadetes bacterium]|nr:hypothetical protein [Gemmatimonadota bacterium]
SVGLVYFSSSELQISSNQREHTQALYVAEAGVAEAVARMNTRPGSTVTVNGATWDPWIGDDPAAPDPGWRTEIHLSMPGTLPLPTSTEVVTATVQPNAGWLRYGDTAAGLDPIVVEHKWEDVDGDGIRDPGEIVLYDADQFPPQNLTSGLPVEVITVPGNLNGSRRDVMAEVIHIPLSVRATSAISSDNGVNLTGNMAGCGHNHSLATTPGTKIPACNPFEECSFRTLDLTSGCQVAVQTTGDVAATGGSSDLEGYPTWADTSSTNTFLEVWEYLGISQAQWLDIRNSPDYTSANDATNMDGIVVVSGDATSGEKFNGNVGRGLLYVDGDLDISGNFEWSGFVYCEGNCTITGTAWILGAVAVRGTTTTNAFAAGNSTVLYSRDAINVYVGGRMKFQTLAWSEF